MWSDSPHVDQALGWPIDGVPLREALFRNGYLEKGAAKPANPKGAMEFALKEAKISPSSSIYRAIAQRVSVKRCEDPSFIKFKTILQSWFPAARGD